MPLTLRLLIGSLLVLIGAALLVVAVLGARGRLRRNRWVGVRTAATMRSEQAFTGANRVAAAPLGAAGAVAAAGGAVLLAGAGGALGWVVLAVSVVGTVGLAGTGAAAGDRAAATAGSPGSASMACAGACADCDLVAGCGAAAPVEHAPGAPGS